MDPRLDFWHQLIWEMVENTIYEDTEAGGVYGRLLRARRGTMGDYEIVTAPKYGVKWIVDENKCWRVNQPYKNQICKIISDDCKKITRRHLRCTKGLLRCAECYVTHGIDVYT